MRHMFDWEWNSSSITERKIKNIHSITKREPYQDRMEEKIHLQNIDYRFIHVSNFTQFS